MSGAGRAGLSACGVFGLQRAGWRRVNDRTRAGLLYGLAAYGLWGLVPLYFRLLKDDVSFDEMLAHRIVWSSVFLAAILTGTGRWGVVVRCFRTPKVWLLLAVSAVLVAGNWLVYILSVSLEQIVQASVGYYILQLVSVLIGLAVFGEQLRSWQWVALAVAAVGVVGMTLSMGEVPWIALTLALTFAAYGAIRKTVPVDGLTGLAVETFLLLPAAGAYLGWSAGAGTMAVGIDSGWLLGAVAASGVVTAVPLLCFGQAARRLPLSLMGFMQYLSPTLQLVVAIVCFGERPPAGSDWVYFGLIWAALAIFTAESLAGYRKTQRPCVAAVAPAEMCET